MIRVVLYCEELLKDWNEVLNNSKNGTFMHRRSFMEYHKHRFEDFSLLVYDDEVPVAIFPANRKNDQSIATHSGLTFGGFIVNRNIYTKMTILYFSKMLEYCASLGFERILFKQIPSFYCSVSHEEIDYIMFILNAKLIRVDIASSINQKSTLKIPVQSRRFRSIKKAEKLDAKVLETESYAEFWNEILVPNLRERFGVAPVHSLAEIESLSRNNYPCIRQFNVVINGTLMAGTTIFETATTAHAQYISASNEGRRNGSLDFLFKVLIEEVFHEKDYFDFGIVNENDGRKINEGLLDWKEGFGARSYAHRFYEINPSDYIYLDTLYTQ